MSGYFIKVQFPASDNDMLPFLPRNNQNFFDAPAEKSI